MASIRLEFPVRAPSDEVWQAFAAVDQVHRALAPGFVTSCVMHGDTRIITFANGFVAHELIVDIDNTARRLAYSARGNGIDHHHASFQIFDDGRGSSRIAWIADVLPASAAGMVREMMETGVAAMQRQLEQREQPGRE